MRAGQLLILYGGMEQLCTASMIRSVHVKTVESAVENQMKTSGILTVNMSLRGTKKMNRYYVFVVNVICYTYTYTHKEYSEAVETLNSVINAMPKNLLPVRGCILNDDMEVIMSRFESGE